MKKILLSISCFLAGVLSLPAQTFFGTTTSSGSAPPYDGNKSGGTIHKISTATNELTIVYKFDFYLNNDYYPSFIQASNGKLYGIADQGGKGFGAIFSFTPSTSTFTKLMDFDSINGANPLGSLLEANDGKLYGTTSGGGINGAGVIFSFDPSTSIYKKLIDFNKVNGAKPRGNLIQAKDGKLYGTTFRGGNFGAGVIFSYDVITSVYTLLKDFDGQLEGLGPNSLLQASDGKFYGMTTYGGNKFLGVIFSFNPSGNIFKKLLDFGNNNGSSPEGGLMQAKDGKLYGMASDDDVNSAGVIFSFNIFSNKYSILKYFKGTDGSQPKGNLIQANNGKLYGTTSGGGAYDGGVIFSFEPLASTYLILKDFKFPEGQNPRGNLLQAADGKLYGLTSSFCVIFSYDLSLSHYSRITSFREVTNGLHPFGMIQANNGKLYGYANGGKKDSGVIFSFDPHTLIYTKLEDFVGSNGSYPKGKLVQASNGKLFGMTLKGGRNGLGVIFSIDPSTSIITKLLDFDGNNGASPEDGLMQTSDGLLYGMTSSGGVHNSGVIFSYNPISSIYKKLKDFNEPGGADGSSPYGRFVQAKDGKLYATAFGGGSNGLGVIFSFDPATSIYKKLKDFNTNGDGLEPKCTLIQASNGKLYGTVRTYDYLFVAGIIFSFDPVTADYQVLYGSPRANIDPTNLMLASNGKFYGSSVIILGFGLDNYFSAGIIFSFDPSTNTFKQEIEFNGVNGAFPNSPLTEVKDCIRKTYYRDADGDGFGDPNCHLTACTQPAGYVTNNSDCDDNNKAVHAAITYYRDEDNDGFGDQYVSVKSCTQPAGYVKNNFDCDDHKRAHNPRVERVKMCRNGNQECVFVKDIFKMICRGWTLGPCTHKCSNMASISMINTREKLEKFSEEQSIPQSFKLSNYPNPFAGSSTIKYELPNDSKVSIKVYDVLGRTVATLVDSNKKAGTYTVIFNAGHLNNGTLYYRMIATSKDNQFEQTNQMILLR